MIKLRKLIRGNWKTIAEYNVSEREIAEREYLAAYVSYPQGKFVLEQGNRILALPMANDMKTAFPSLPELIKATKEFGNVVSFE